MHNMSYQLKKPSNKKTSIRMISEWGVLRGTKKKLKKEFKTFMEQGYPCFLRNGIYVPEPIALPLSFPFKLKNNGSSCATLYVDREQFKEFNRDLKTFQYLTSDSNCYRNRQDISYDEQREINEHLLLIRDAYERP